MGKYDPLGAFLRRWRSRNSAEGLELTLDQIEGIIRGVLPRGAGEGHWWTNDAECGPHQRAWTDAGFAADFDPKTERIFFRCLSPVQ